MLRSLCTVRTEDGAGARGKSGPVRAVDDGAKEYSPKESCSLWAGAEQLASRGRTVVRQADARRERERSVEVPHGHFGKRAVNSRK